MTPYAQTNIQLYSQLFQAAWAETDLRRVQAAYELAMPIFAGHFRPNHKPFLAHLVGVASILAAHGADSTTVAAGLLHSAYSHGEFGDGSREMTPRKRRQVCRAVGAPCEAIVAHYACLSWCLPKIVARSTGVEHLSAADRTVTLVKLADVLEDHLDRGMQYSPNKRLAGHAETQLECRDALVKLAASLGHHALAANLQCTLDPSDAPRVPDFLRGVQPGSFVVAPVSHRMRTTVRLGRLYRRWRSKLAFAPRHSSSQAA
jgi:(p)ppGpp synthase/HD superfamily hydrolase